MDSFTTFLEHYFVTSSTLGCQSRSTVLAAAATARDAKMQEGDGIDALLVHIVMDCSSVNESLGRRVLERFVEMVRERRQKGEAVTILVSTDCLQYMPGRKYSNTIGCTEALTVTASCDAMPDSDLQKRMRTGIINTQRMRRLMRSSLPADMFSAELLTYSSDWAAADRGQTYESFGKKIWSTGQINKAVTLLTGRAWKQKGSSSQMSFTDIGTVLEYLDLFHQQETKTKDQTTEEPSDAENPHQNAHAISPRESMSPATTPPDSNPDDETRGWPSVVSPAGQLWEKQKSQQNCHNAALDSLMGLVGMEKPKSQFMAIKNLVTTARRQNANLAEERFGAVFVGGPGSGKSTVAELYADFLSTLQIVPCSSFEKTTGTRLASGGVAAVRDIIQRLEWTNMDQEDCRRSWGVILIDEAHEMAHNTLIFNFLMDEVRRLQGDVVFLFTGPRDEMQSFMGLSSSFRSHVPFTFVFDDFTDVELHQILVQQLHSKFRGQMLVEGGVNGVFMRTLTRRIGRGRGGGCFSNALEVQNTLSSVLLRQAERLSSSRMSRESADDMFLTRTDLLGPLPTSTLKSTAWDKLQEMTGLASVKQSIQALVTRLQTNHERELAEEPLLETSLNKVFLGGPGTGKTTVAKYYGQILSELGLLSNGEVIVKNCQDFFSVYANESAELTKQILDSAKGRVLIIDEAYGLAQGTVSSDSVIDTIVANVQATSTEDRAVLLLGYKDEMEEMFRKVNPGLARRFPISSAFEFHDFTDKELRMILEKKLKTQGFVASEQAKQVAMGVLSRARNRANFGNAGEVDILLDRAKEAQQIRLGKSTDTNMLLLTELKEVDFDPEIDRRSRGESNTQEDFADLVGAESLVAQFQRYQRIAQNAKGLGLDPKELIPFNFVFRGPPGTGKTTAARKLGRIFFDMGFLATKEVNICSASELMAEYLGQTGPKTQRVFEKALGKVLLIDEAYRLGDPDFSCRGVRYTSYAKEAVDEMVNLLTLPKYKNNIVVVLAGYDREMNQLLATNPGLGSRFSEVVQFSSLSPKHCYELFMRLLSDQKLGVSSLHHPSVAAKVQARFQTLSDLPNWGNARDVENLAKFLFGKFISSPMSSPSLDVTPECVYDGMMNMIAERKKRTRDSDTFPRRK